MMRVCLDTNAYSAFKQGVEATVRTLEECDAVYVPSAVVGELYAGFYGGSRARQNIEALHEFLDGNGIEEVPVTHAVAERYGRLVAELRKTGRPIPTNDIWIAATAMETGARLLTYDRHFDAIPGLLVIAP